MKVITQSSFIFNLYQSLRLLPYGTKLQIKSIYTKHSILPMNINTGYDYSTSDSQKKFSLARKPFSVTRKQKSVSGSCFHAPPFQK